MHIQDDIQQEAAVHIQDDIPEEVAVHIQDIPEDPDPADSTWLLDSADSNNCCRGPSFASPYEPKWLQTT